MLKKLISTKFNLLKNIFVNKFKKDAYNEEESTIRRSLTDKVGRTYFASMIKISEKE